MQLIEITLAIANYIFDLLITVLFTYEITVSGAEKLTRAQYQPHLNYIPRALQTINVSMAKPTIGFRLTLIGLRIFNSDKAKANCIRLADGVWRPRRRVILSILEKLHSGETNCKYCWWLGASLHTLSV